MPISRTIELIRLIQSLTPAEKRNFKLYSSRNHAYTNLKFIDLFDLLEKMETYDESTLLIRLELTKSQLSNLKRHLYTQILKSLRIITVSKKPNIQVRSLIDYAYILYERGLYNEALKVLRQGKKLAEEYHLYNMHLVIIEFEKKIESRHITRSGKDKAIKLVTESSKIQNHLDLAVRLSNLRLQLHGYYLERGHCQNQEERDQLEDVIEKALQNIDLYTLGPLEKVYLQQSYVWYFYILLDFKNSLQHAEKWLHVLEQNPELIEKDIDIFFRAYHYILSSCYHLADRQKLKVYLEKIERYRNTNYNRFNQLTKIISFLYVHSARLNHIILSGQFIDSKIIIDKSLKRIKRYKNNLDEHRILVFYFKIAWIHFGAKHYAKAIFYLNKIVNNELPKLREDLQIYARLLFLMCHYELKNLDIFDYSIRSFQTYFGKRKNLYPLQEILQDCFLNIAVSQKSEHKKIMIKTRDQIIELKKNPFHKVSLTYLDALSWLESKVTSKSLAQVIQEKR